MTDPILYSEIRPRKNDTNIVPHKLTDMDWNKTGMQFWMENHSCNETCQKLDMQYNQEMTRKLKKYYRRFKNGGYDLKVLEKQLLMLANK